MSLMLAKTYEAFIAAGAPKDKAQEASEEIAGFEKEISDIKGDLKVIKFTAALILAVVVFPYLKTLFP